MLLLRLSAVRSRRLRVRRRGAVLRRPLLRRSVLRRPLLRGAVLRTDLRRRLRFGGLRRRTEARRLRRRFVRPRRLTSSEDLLKPDEFAEAFARDVRLFWTVAAAHGPRALAEDVVQDAAAVALRNLRELKDPAAFRPWLARIVRNAARNLSRRERRRATEDGVDVAATPSRRPTSSSLVPGAFDADALDLDDRLTAALASLSEDARASLVLSVVHDLSYTEIGALLDLPPGTVGSHVSRARRALKDRFAPEEARHDD
jgi:RNA polymerase sigma-70 factor, ECF subfamily